jgi:hypothetical protein
LTQLLQGLSRLHLILRLRHKVHDLGCQRSCSCTVYAESLTLLAFSGDAPALVLLGRSSRIVLALGSASISHKLRSIKRQVKCSSSNPKAKPDVCEGKKEKGEQEQLD